MKRLWLFIVLAIPFVATFAFGVVQSVIQVTDQLIEKVVSELAADFKCENCQDANRLGIQAMLAMSTYEYAGQGQLSALEKESAGSDVGTLAYGRVRLILDTTRKALNNSRVVNSIYNTGKPKLIAEIKKHEIETQVRDQLERILPFFEGRLHPTAKAALTFRLELSKRMTETHSPESIQQAFFSVENVLDEFGITTFNVYAYEFVERRRAEGGDDLVETYTGVIKDLIEALTPRPESVQN